MLLTKANIVQALQSNLVRPTSDFDLNSDGQKVSPKKDAAVLVPILETAGGLQLVLTKRAAHLNSHPGQIAFPGGRRDDTDQNLTETALREAEEEIGLLTGLVSVLGTLPPHNTVTAYQVTPVLGWVEHDWKVIIDPGEVADVFHVPLDHLMNSANFRIQSRKWMGVDRYYYVVPYGPYYIWGATARILRAMSELFES